MNTKSHFVSGEKPSNQDINLIETVIGGEPICKSGVVQITCSVRSVHHSVHRLKRENG